jgi:hypothetical protein
MGISPAMRTRGYYPRVAIIAIWRPSKKLERIPKSGITVIPEEGKVK